MMIDIYEKLIEFKQKHIDMVLVTAVEKEGEGPVEVGKKMLVIDEHTFFGTVGGGALEHYAIQKALTLIKKRHHLTEKYLLDKGKVIEDTKTLPMVCGGQVTLYYEFIGFRNHVYLFGGGHVGRALAEVLKTLQFYVIMIDERKPIVDAFVDAHEKHHMRFIDYIKEHGIKEDSLVVVVTPSHTSDYHVINQIIEQQFKPKYVGMMCSIEKLKDYLKETYQRFGRDIDLSRFYSPIGLNLGGGSPEEIAISIASELLAIEHGKSEIKHMREMLDDNNRYW
ncbi:MAG TPA: XdhC/CoxI family protein [Acholeplasmataceae bacterium]|nr:XdhC/CoxI family protein [Acholeplasmataceae bacterium]